MRKLVTAQVYFEIEVDDENTEITSETFDLEVIISDALYNDNLGFGDVVNVEDIEDEDEDETA